MQTISDGERSKCINVWQSSSGGQASSSTATPHGTTFTAPVQLHLTISTPWLVTIKAISINTDNNMRLTCLISTAKIRKKICN
ncbi:MAG: hypothetical protein IKR17_05775 [Bacteroidales bacterium]|nr:hypothetical protein [Bacteroidales bacterium]